MVYINVKVTSIRFKTCISLLVQVYQAGFLRVLVKKIIISSFCSHFCTSRKPGDGLIESQEEV